MTTTDRATYLRGQKRQLHGMLEMYQEHLAAKVLDDLPNDMDHIAGLLADDVKKLGLIEAKFLLTMCGLLRSDT